MLRPALGCYLVFVAVVTLTPRMPASSTVGSVVTRALDHAHARGIAMGVDFLVVEFMGNVVMFVPIGVLVALVAVRQRLWILLGVGPLLSAFLELVQLLFLPDRFSEVRDILSNSIGYVLGLLSVLLIRSIRRRRRVNRHDRSIGRDPASSSVTMVPNASRDDPEQSTQVD